MYPRRDAFATCWIFYGPLLHTLPPKIMVQKVVTFHRLPWSCGRKSLPCRFAGCQTLLPGDGVVYRWRALWTHRGRVCFLDKNWAWTCLNITSGMPVPLDISDALHYISHHHNVAMAQNRDTIRDRWFGTFWRNSFKKCTRNQQAILKCQ